MDRRSFDLDAELAAGGLVWVAGLGAWVPESWVIAGIARQDDAAKRAAGWERVQGGWIVATSGKAAPKKTTGQTPKTRGGGR